MILLVILVALTADRLKEIDLKNLRLVLSQIQIAKADLAVTREEINALVDEIAFISMTLVSEQIVGQKRSDSQTYNDHLRDKRKLESIGNLTEEAKTSWWIDNTLQKILDRERKRQQVTQRISRILSKSGRDTGEIAQLISVTEALTRRNVLDHIRSVTYTLITREISNQIKSGKLSHPGGPFDYIGRLPIHKASAALSQPNSKLAIKTLFEPHGLWTTQMEDLIRKFEEFCSEFPCVKGPAEPLDPQNTY